MLWSIETRGGLLGPYDTKELRGLARAGVISADTPLVNPEGRKVTAGRLRGMKFGEPQDVEPPPPLTQRHLPPAVPIPSGIQTSARLTRRWLVIGGAIYGLKQLFKTLDEPSLKPRVGMALHSLRNRRENTAKKQKEEEARKRSTDVTPPWGQKPTLPKESVLDPQPAPVQLRRTWDN